MIVDIWDVFEHRVVKGVDYVVVSAYTIEIYYLNGSRESFAKNGYTQITYKED